MSRFALSALLMVCTAVLASAGGKSGKKPAKQTPLTKAYEKYNVVFQKYAKVKNKLIKNKELASLYKAWQDTEKALKKQLDTLLKPQRAAEKAAIDALNAAVQKLIAENKDIIALNKTRNELSKKKRDLYFEIAKAELHLYHNNSPLQQALDADAGLEAKRKAQYKGDRKERFAARNAYINARRDKLKSMKAAQQYFSNVADLKTEIKTIDKKRFEAWNKATQIERSLYASKDKNLQALREKVTEARNATRKAKYQQATKKARDAAFKANNAYRKKYNDLVKANKELQSFQKQLNAINTTIRELRSKNKKTSVKKGK